MSLTCFPLLFIKENMHNCVCGHIKHCWFCLVDIIIQSIIVITWSFVLKNQLQLSILWCIENEGVINIIIFHTGYIEINILGHFPIKNEIWVIGIGKILGQRCLIFDAKYILITDIHWYIGIQILQYPPRLIAMSLFS